jgi:Uncharacterised nucleotidyltransferase
MLLCLARREPDAGARARARALVEGPFDWDFFVEAATRHGLLPLAYKHLSASFSGSVPAAALGRLRSLCRDNAARNLFLTGELRRVLDAFDAAGVVGVPYKGPALAVAAYGDPSLRQSLDLDVLVRPRDVERATSALLGLGYGRTLLLRDYQEEGFKRISYVRLFVPQGGEGFGLELHWNVSPRCFSVSFDTDELFGRLQTITLNGRPVPSPPAEDLLLMLCVHAAKDCWGKLEWVASIAELARRPGFDWETLYARAGRAGAARAVSLGLHLAHAWLDAPLPESVLSLVGRDRRVRELAGEVAGWLLGARPRPLELPRMVPFHLRTKERWRDKIRYALLFSTTPMPFDWDLIPVRLPGPLAFVYYFLRPFRLVKRYAFDRPRRAS